MVALRSWWESFREKHPEFSTFAMFFLVSNGVTVLQLALMPIFRNIFAGTNLISTDFQVLPVGSNVDGSQYFMFDYAAGALPEGGGGLAYFLAVQITILIAQVINFFLQRSVAFRSKAGIAKAALWYFIAYVVITFIAAAAQGFYKVPIYEFFMGKWGAAGETTADVITMIINSAISFWVFYPILKVIFKDKRDDLTDTIDPASAENSASQ